MSGYWVIQAQRLCAMGYGFTPIPIFYLHEDVQGILSESAAREVALEILRTAASDEWAEFSIYAAKVG